MIKLHTLRKVYANCNLIIVLYTFQKYGGFYKHNVDTCLNGADRLFHEMGYGPTPAESLVLDGPVDQDRATVVARDCILACVECQILVAAMQGPVHKHLIASFQEGGIKNVTLLY